MRYTLKTPYRDGTGQASYPREPLLTPAAAEPFMPAEGTAVLENLAFDLAREASQLSAQLHPVVRLSVAGLVRSMNCYYSNLIEGHNAHPRDIEDRKSVV